MGWTGVMPFPPKPLSFFKKERETVVQPSGGGPGRKEEGREPEVPTFPGWDGMAKGCLPVFPSSFSSSRENDDAEATKFQLHL